jgi:hypothetical protein
VQTQLYKEYKKAQDMDDTKKNFFTMWKALAPVHNHPPTLDVKDSSVSRDSWWKDVFKPRDLTNVESGYKMILLLHILVHAQHINDRVLIFSESIRTLDFVGKMLALEDWSAHMCSLEETFPGKKLGGWQKDRDFLYLNGTTSAYDRGRLVDEFNNEHSTVKAFMISSRAGSLGINLTAANRVVLLDGSFNPTIATQAVFRAWRYGQTKETFCFLTEGTIEQKIYARSVSKSGIALRVIDNKSCHRNFSAAELDDLTKSLTWVGCDECGKWRVLPDTEDLAGQCWNCSMNPEIENDNCEKPERSQLWYEARALLARNRACACQKQNPISTLSPTKCMADDSEDCALPDADTLRLTDKDRILKHLLEIVHKRNKKNHLVSRHDFHEALLESTVKYRRGA